MCTIVKHCNVSEKCVRKSISQILLLFHQTLSKIHFISYSPYYYPLDVDPVAVYYWLAAGIVLKIPELERQEREKAAALAIAASGEEPPVISKRRRGQSKAKPTFE